MKIVDPVGGERRHKARFSRKTCVCGCFALLVLFILMGLPLLTILLRGDPVPPNPPDPAAARRLQEKLDTIERHYDPMALLRGDTFRTTEMSEAEINAYIEAIRPQLKPPWDEAMLGLHIDIESGRVVIRSEIDLNELGGDVLKGLPWPYQVETRVDLIGRLDTIEGKGRFILETLKLGAVPIPGDTALDLLVRLAPRAGPYRELLKGFPLPFGAGVSKPRMARSSSRAPRGARRNSPGVPHAPVGGGPGKEVVAQVGKRPRPRLRLLSRGA